MEHKLPVNDIIEWDIPNWSQLIPFWLPVLKDIPRNAKVLAIGERNGGLSLMMALMGFEVTCTDRTGPSEYATALLEKYKVLHLIKNAAFDVVNDTMEERYDIILAKSVIGGLKKDPGNKATRSFEVQRMAVDNIYHLLKPGGYFLSAENMQGSLLARKYKKWQHKEAGWRYLGTEEFRALFNPFQEVEIKSFGVLPTGFSDKWVNQLCFWINRYLLNFLPAKYKYIGFAIAKK